MPFYNVSMEDTDWYDGTSTFIDRKVTHRSLVDGRCIFGALRHTNATWGRKIAMNSGVRNISKKGEISNIDGGKIFGAWEKNSHCDSLINIQEPSVFPPIQATQTPGKAYVNNENQASFNNMNLFVGIMCRSIPLKTSLLDNTTDAQQTVFTKHIKPIRYSPEDYLFDPSSPKEACYYTDRNNYAFPKGLLGIEKCAHGSPLAVSLPHFLHADKWYVG